MCVCNARPINDAVVRAVRHVIDTLGMDARVLDLSSGAGLHAMAALRAGARHVTCCERWLYLAMAAKESFVTNDFNDDQAKVVYKRPSDLLMPQDVPVACNVLLAANLLEDGALGAGIIPAIKHIQEKALLVPDAVVIPSALTVRCQAVQIKTPAGPDGLTLDASDRHRWFPAYGTGTAFSPDAITPLSDVVEAFHFNLNVPPDSSNSVQVDLAFQRDGIFNAVMFWFDAALYDDIVLGSGWDGIDRTGVTTLRPAVQFLPGELLVEQDQRLTLRASHNTICINFSIDEAEYISVTSADASVPYNHFSMLADTKRNSSYARAIERAVERAIASSAEGEAHVLDMGTGMGLLAMLAAKAGATTVTAAELHPGLCASARQNIAANGLSSIVSVVERDIGLLERGREIRRRGCNVAVADFFDAGLTGNHFEYMLDLARRNILQQSAVVVPAAATLYCMGIEALTGDVDGFDMSPINKYRWDSDYQTTRLGAIEHRRLTKPTKVFELFFDGVRKSRGREAVLKLPVIEDGILNAIVFWFDLHLDDTETITSAPFGIGLAGEVEEAFPRDMLHGLDAMDLGDDTGGGEGASSESRALEAARAIAEALKAGNDTDEAAAAALAAAKEIRNGMMMSPPPPSGASVDARAAFDASTQGVDAVDGEDGEVNGMSLATSERENGHEAKLHARDKIAEEHYWGQAVQYLERAVKVERDRKVTVLAKRDKNRVKFSLREGTGVTVGKPPWKVEWGGGASVESPHVQRVHYCELLVSDFLMRLKCKRFPPIEKDLKIALAQCGALFLEPGILQTIYHEFCVMELIHGSQEYGPGTSMEAMTAPPLEHH